MEEGKSGWFGCGMWDNLLGMHAPLVEALGHTFPIVSTYFPPCTFCFSISLTCFKYYIKSKGSWYRVEVVGLDVGCGPIGLGCMLH